MAEENAPQARPESNEELCQQVAARAIEIRAVETGEPDIFEVHLVGTFRDESGVPKHGGGIVVHTGPMEQCTQIHGLMMTLLLAINCETVNEVYDMVRRKMKEKKSGYGRILTADGKGKFNCQKCMRPRPCRCDLGLE